uniref:ISXO2-like transposase domain-containing protein n=1 Tax=Trichuris muris TaxID=70415 RepID=A0A5S6QDA4_TRIMR
MCSIARLSFSKLCSKLVGDELAAVEFMQSTGLMRWRRICLRCARPVVLQHRKDRDCVVWRCNRKHCQKQLSAKTGTWFQGYQHPVKTMLLIMCAWSQKLTTLHFCRLALELPVGAAVKLNAAMRPVAEEWLLKNPKPVGGPGITVELDESLFARRKYNRGRMLPQASVRRYAHICHQRERSGQIECSQDERRGYYGLADEHYTHLRLNHSINFFDPGSGAHMQTVESLWSHAKHGNKARRGTHRS